MPNEAVRKKFEALARDMRLSVAFHEVEGFYLNPETRAVYRGFLAGFEALAVPVRAMREAQKSASVEGSFIAALGPGIVASYEATVDALTAQGGKKE